MPEFTVIHYSPGVTRQQLAQNVPDIQHNTHATLLHCYGNMADGATVHFYEADDAVAVEREMKQVGFPFTRSRRSRSRHPRPTPGPWSAAGTPSADVLEAAVTR